MITHFKFLNSNPPVYQGSSASSDKSAAALRDQLKPRPLKVWVLGIRVELPLWHLILLLGNFSLADLLSRSAQGCGTCMGAISSLKVLMCTIVYAP